MKEKIFQKELKEKKRNLRKEKRESLKQFKIIFLFNIVFFVHLWTFNQSVSIKPTDIETHIIVKNVFSALSIKFWNVEEVLINTIKTSVVNKIIFNSTDFDEMTFFLILKENRKIIFWEFFHYFLGRNFQNNFFIFAILLSPWILRWEFWDFSQVSPKKFAVWGF